MADKINAIGFEGVPLNSLQRNGLKKYIRSVLGEGNYALAEDFFVSIWNSPARYKVFLARRCLNLMYTFYRANYAAPDPDLSSTLYSDGSLLACIPDIAENYLQWGGFPEIIIVDDILIHGRTMNVLIDNLINGVCEHIEKKRCKDERGKIESVLLNALTIKVMVQTNKPLLLHEQYYQCLKTKPDQSDVWVTRQWRELSLRISQLILENFFYNTSYVLSMHTTPLSVNEASLENAAKIYGFEKTEYSGRFKRTVWVKPLKRSNGEIAAFYTIRISPNRINGDICIVPFVIMADFDGDLGRSILGQNVIANKLLKDFVDNESCGRTKAEALYLLLSHNLLLLLQDANVKLTPGLFDVDKISIAFKSSSIDKTESLPKRVAELTAPFMSWEEMDTLILNATEGSQPLFESAGTGDATNYDRVIEDMIAQEGNEMERNAYLEYNQGLYSPDRTGRNPITELFSKLSKHVNIKSISLSGLVSKLLELMDMGSTAVSTKKSDISGRNYIICGYRPGEQSLFILPKRYAQDIPTLIEIEKDCYSHLNIINRRIDVLYENTPERRDELKKFVTDLYESGQRLLDWDINMLLWSEISDETRRMYSGKSDEYLLTAQMILNMSKQSELMTRYRELYPENQ